MLTNREIEMKAQLTHEREINDTLRDMLITTRAHRDSLQNALQRTQQRIDAFRASTSSETEQMMVKLLGSSATLHGDL